MNKNGSPSPTFETDDERTYFLAVLPVHPDVTELSKKNSSIIEAGKSSRVLGELGTCLSQVCPKSVPSVGADVILLNLYEEKEQSIGVLMEWVTESNRTRFRKNYLNPLMKCNLVAFTIPEKPTSSKQEYKLTVKGIEFVESVIETVDKLYNEQGGNK